MEMERRNIVEILTMLTACLSYVVEKRQEVGAHESIAVVAVACQDAQQARGHARNPRIGGQQQRRDLRQMGQHTCVRPETVARDTKEQANAGNLHVGWWAARQDPRGHIQAVKLHDNLHKVSVIAVPA